jgi:hypothetical protein
MDSAIRFRKEAHSPDRQFRMCEQVAATGKTVAFVHSDYSSKVQFVWRGSHADRLSGQRALASLAQRLPGTRFGPGTRSCCTQEERVSKALTTIRRISFLRFGYLDFAVSWFRESAELKEAITVGDLEARLLLLALERRMQQRDQEIEALQCELSRHSRVPESAVEAEASMVRAPD